MRLQAAIEKYNNNVHTREVILDLEEGLVNKIYDTILLNFQLWNRRNSTI